MGCGASADAQHVSVHSDTARMRRCATAPAFESEPRKESRTRQHDSSAGAHCGHACLNSRSSAACDGGQLSSPAHPSSQRYKTGSLDNGADRALPSAAHTVLPPLRRLSRSRSSGTGVEERNPANLRNKHIKQPHLESSPSFPSLSLPARTESPPPSSSGDNPVQPHLLYSGGIATQSKRQFPHSAANTSSSKSHSAGTPTLLPALSISTVGTPPLHLAKALPLRAEPPPLSIHPPIDEHFASSQLQQQPSPMATPSSVESAGGVSVHDSRFVAPAALGQQPASFPGGFPAPFPQNEDERVQALLDYKIMDSCAEAAFDQLAVLASQICQTPIALVSLIDHERQWFKARVGLEPPETHRDLAFCAHAILQDDVFEIADAASDWRFSDSPLVTGAPNIRFYAGMPLINNDGFPLGTLCAIDTKPKQLTEDQRKALRILSAQTVAQLELRRHVARLTETMVQVHDTKSALQEQIRVSELARADAERARAEAEKANRAKSDFLANMSHEIRTPMNGVLGMATLLSHTTLSKEQSEYVATVQASGEHLLTVLNDILDYSKQESGNLELENMEMDFYSTIEQAVELAFRKEQGLELLIDVQHPDDFLATGTTVLPTPGIDPATCFATDLVGLNNMAALPLPPALPSVIMGDITRLRQVAVNIISNSCKFTPSGGAVRIALGVANRLSAAVGGKNGEALSYESLETLVKNGDVSREYWNRLHGFVVPASASAAGTLLPMAPAVSGDDAHGLQATQFLELQVSISDSGIGIPKDKIHKLFKAFSQLDASTTREYGGTGLGLAISAKLVQQMGGQIWVESEVGRGATFSFTIITPVVKTVHPHVAAAAAASSNGVVVPLPATMDALVNRRLALMPSSPRVAMLVSSSVVYANNLERQLKRWGLDVRRFVDARSAAAWFKAQDAALLAESLAAVLVDYVPKLVVNASPAGAHGRSYRTLSPATSSTSAASAAPVKKVPNATSLDEVTGSLLAEMTLGTLPTRGEEGDVNELAALLRFSETKSNQSSSVPIYYLSSGQLLPEEVLSVEDLGITFVRKPLLLSKMRQLMQSCVGLHKGRSASLEAVPRGLAAGAGAARKLAETYPLSVLICEDNKVNMKLAVKMLGNFGFAPVSAYNGLEAIDLVITQQRHFDLIFMDMIMPEKDGCDTAQEILAHYNAQLHAATLAGIKSPPPPQQQLPPVIIAMTASAMESDRRSCTAAGMVDFVAKPTRMLELQTKLTHWAKVIHAHKQAARSSSPAPAPLQQSKPKVLTKAA